MGNSFGQVIVLIVNSLGHLVILALLLRFLLQASRADFYNPVSQALVKVTAPVLNPLRRIIPAWRNFDIATLLLAWVLSTLATALMLVILNIDFAESGVGISTLLSWSFVGLISYVLKIYFWGLLISVIVSWVAPYSGNPALLLIQQILEPLQRLFRKVIPPMGGLDLSPIFIFLGIQVLEIMVVGTLARGFSLGQQGAQFVIGI